MILLLIGQEESIKKLAEDISKASSFIVSKNTQLNNYEEKYLEAIKSGQDIIFIRHHIMPSDYLSISRDTLPEDFRTKESELKKDITVIYLKDNLDQNTYEIDFICSRISKLNWLITKGDVSAVDVLNNINDFNKVRIKNI